MRLKVLGATLAVVVTIGSLTTGAGLQSPEPRAKSHGWHAPDDPSVPSGSPLDECITAAQDVMQDSDAETWSCMGGELVTASTDVRGERVQESKQVVPYAVEWQSADAITAADDYDSWCEAGSICGRPISTYIAEVKGNGAYGDADGVIGSFDQVLRGALNGRQPAWRALLDWDSGPKIMPQSFTIRCRKHVADGADPICGTAKTWYAGDISSTSPRTWYPNSTTYKYLGVNLGGSTTKYHDDFFGTFFASGESPLFSTGVLHTGRYTGCSNTCKYYQVPWTSSP